MGTVVGDVGGSSFVRHCSAEDLGGERERSEGGRCVCVDVAVFQSKEQSYYNSNRMRGSKGRDDEWFRKRGEKLPSFCRAVDGLDSQTSRRVASQTMGNVSGKRKLG